MQVCCFAKAVPAHLRLLPGKLPFPSNTSLVAEQ